MANQFQNGLQFDSTGNLLVNLTNIGQANTLVALGDSITARLWAPGSLTSLTGTVGGLTVTAVQTAHGFNVGDLAKIDGPDQREFAGNFTVATVPDANTFTYAALTPLTVTSPTGTLVSRQPRLLGNNGYWTWADLLLSGRFVLLNNGGIAGERLAEIAARVTLDVLAFAPQYCVFLAGTNDVRGGTTDSTVLFGLWKTAVLPMLAAGVTVICGTVMTYATGDANLTTAKVQAIQDFNYQIRQFCARTRGAILWDTHAAWIDPTQTDGRVLANMCEDTLHPSPLGAYNMGLALSNALSPLARVNLSLPSSLADAYGVTSTSKNLADNPLFVTTGSGVVGAGVAEGSGAGTSVASSWRAEVFGTCTATASLVARTVVADGDTLGNNQRMVFAMSANNDSGQIRQNGLSARIVTGDVIYAECAVSASTLPATLKRFNLNINLTVAGVIYSSVTGSGASTSNVNPTANVAGVLRSPPMKVPAGSITALEIVLFVQTTGAAAGFTVNMGRAQLRKA